jgi:hypothetical protein
MALDPFDFASGVAFDPEGANFGGCDGCIGAVAASCLVQVPARAGDARLTPNFETERSAR